MKKMKKEKKKKEHSRKTWPIWLTILLVILGVGAVSGVTVLGVYLANGFNENVINPADIYFSYDENLYNENTSQLEVVEDFTMMVDSSTSFVTNDRVTLSFENASSVTRRNINGVTYIANGVIQVPEIVHIREQFTVTLMTQDLLDDDNTILAEDWIKGGISSLVATSDYNRIPQTEPLQIAVDVPVWDIEIVAVNSSEQETNQIITGEAFTLETRFIPASSQYIYSDDLNSAIAQENKRVKHTYYLADAGQYAGAISTRYDEKYNISFLAGNETIDNITMRGYSFRHANNQIEAENSVETTTNEAFYSQILGILTSAGQDVAVQDEQSISIGLASIDRFTVSKSSQTISMDMGQSLTLYMNQYIYDETSNFLGVNIYSTSGSLIDGMLSNIAINFNYSNQDPTIDSFLQVSGGDYVEIDGLRYYRPNSNVSNLNYSYWTLHSSREATVSMTVVLLIENEGGGYTLFGSPLTYNVNLEITEHHELPIHWADSSNIDVMLNYNSDGDINSQIIDLESLIQIPEDNIYQDHIFFAWFGDGDKAELRDTVDGVIGSTGYNYELSGIYATTENLLLFAINGTSLTLQNAGSFRLYYATIVTENGVPVYETDGTGNRTYSIAVMSQEYILVTCEKSLYKDSVSAGEVNTDNFEPLGNGEIAIDQGSQNTISISFIVDSEALSVFTDEYNKGYMSLVIKDEQNNDISSNFTVISHQLTLDGTTGDSILTYQVIVNTGVNIQSYNGIYLSQVALKYDNTNGTVIEWNMPINDRKICIYSPQAQSLIIDTTYNQSFINYINGNEKIQVNQTLNTDGNFITNITANEQSFNSVDSLLSALLGENNIYVVITDQKRRIDTLANSWHFALMNGSDTNAINLNGQTFTFRQATNAQVNLELVTIDGNASSIENGQQLKFDVTSIGITKAESLSSYDPYPLAEYQDNEYVDSNISNLSVTLYGAKYDGGILNEGIITLANLVKFYIGEENLLQYERIKFQLSQQYLNDTTLTDEMIVDLFNNTNGMIILYDENGEVISGLSTDALTIKQQLSGRTISAISFRNNFAIDHIIRFSIMDTGTNGAINSTLSLTISTSYTVSAENYPLDINEPLYANNETLIINTVTNNYLRYKEEENYTSEFASLYVEKEGESDLYYIVSKGSGYVLINKTIFDTDEQYKDTSYIGTFDSSTGEIKFEDFWNVKTKDFSITFTPEGENYFTFKRIIQFTVTSDLGIENLGETYYIINNIGSNYNINNFISIYRLSQANAPEGDKQDFAESLDLVFEFDKYFNVLNTREIIKAEDKPFLFDYNVKELSTTLKVYYVERNEQNEIINKVELGQVIIPIELYTDSLQENYDVYSEIANILSYKSEDAVINAQIQNVGDTEYVMVQQGTWFLNSTFVGGTGYKVYANMIDNSGNWLDTYYDAYENELEQGTDLTFKNVRSKVLQGLDEKVYLVLYFASADDVGEITFPGTTAVMYVPLIISSIGFDYVNYQESMVKENEKLQTAITDPNNYIENGEYKGAYQTINAGQLTTIMTQYNFIDQTQTTGLYLLNGYSYTVAFTYHPLASSSLVVTSEDIIKQFIINSVDGEQIGEISLNHLSNVYQYFYLAIKFTISSTSESMDFYYVYKVKPDVIVEDSVYAYNNNPQGAAEYLQGQQNIEGEVDFNEIFNSTTLAENKKRFNITKQFDIVGIQTQTDQTSPTEPTLSPLTEVEVELESSKMQLWISILNGDEIEYQREIPYPVTKPENNSRVKIDLKSIFGEENVNITVGNTVNLSILSGNGKIYYNQVEMFSNLNETNEIESITVGEEQYFIEDDWKQYIDIYFSQDTQIMYYTPLTSEQITIIIKHSYQGGNLDDELSVVGGEQYYQFIINSTNYNYSVKFTNGENTFITNSSNKIYTWKEANSTNNSIQVNLLQGVDAGSTGYEEVWDKLHIALTDEYTESGEEFNQSALTSYSYSSSKESNGLLTLNFADYISSARTLEFTVYTDQGYLATLKVEVDASASFAYKEGKNNILVGGSSAQFSDIFDIKLNDEPVTADNYTVEGSVIDSNIYQNFSGKDFVVFENSNGTFIVANLLRDYQVTFQFTITFTESGDTFTFATEMILQGNVEYNPSVNGGNVIAGDDKLISGIFKQISEDLNTEIVYTGSSTSQAFVPTITDGAISTNFVANKVNMDVNLKVRIYFTYNEPAGEITTLVNDDTPYQEFNVIYSLTVYPSVAISIHYPSPNGEDYDGEGVNSGIDREYIDSLSEYESVLNNFILHSSIFGEQTRLVFITASEKDGEIIYSDDDKLTSTTLNKIELSMYVYSQQNATVYSTGTSPKTYYNSNIAIDLSKNLIFERGTLTTSTENGQTKYEIIDDNSTSFVRFIITYEEVQVYYDVYILENSLSVQINNVTKNTASGQYNGQQVNYEKVYIDQTNLTNSMFAQNRMAQITYSANLTRTGSYYLVFTDGTNYYASYSQFINSEDAGRTLILDLGYSMVSEDGQDYEYVGTYSVSTFETNKLTFALNGLISDANGPISSTNINLFGTNYDSLIFESVTLTHRVQLIYGGSANLQVDYKYYSSCLNEFSLNSINSTDVDNISPTNVFKQVNNPDLSEDSNLNNLFDKQDGSTNSTKSFNITYYYMPTIDIDIDDSASSALNMQILEVNHEYNSMVSEFGVRHPSTGQLVNAGDFGLNKASLELQIITKDDVSNENIKDILNEYLSTYNENEFKTSIGGKEYLRPSAITNAGEYAYDYRLLPLGADNQGDLVLIKITYKVAVSSGEFIGKDFYVVVKIIPDYIISFGGDIVDFTEDTVEGNVVSNIDKIYNISELKSGENASTYSKFQLTKSERADSGYVSVKHANGDSAVTNAELATSNFNITLTAPGSFVNGVQFNDSENVEQKLSIDLGSKWTSSSGKYTLSDGATTTFEYAKQVIFGTQYYMIEAEDDYGFKYAVYFSLQSQYSEPYISASNITLTENGYFDIGAQYELLQVSYIEDDNTYHINNVVSDPIVSDTITLVEVYGIQAHLFETAPANGIETNKNGEGYSLDPEKYSLWPEWQDYQKQGYFDVPLIKYVTVDSINFYDFNNEQVVTNKIDLSSKSYTLATTSSGTFNGYDNHRDINSISNPLVIPRIIKTDLFGDSNTAEVQMVIRLKYEKGEGDEQVIEYYDLSSKVTIVRDVTITSNEESVPVRDGVPFKLGGTTGETNGEFNITVAGATVNTDSENVSFINDTLEVLVKANRSTSFQLEMQRGDTTYTAPVSLSNGRTVARTEYISISQQFGINVQVGDTVRIIPSDNNAEFYYITNNGNGIVNNHYTVKQDNNVYSIVGGDITISTITNDVVYIEDSSLIDNSNHYYSVRKYYVLSLTIGEGEDAINYTYRISKNYNVIGYFYNLQRAVPGDMIMNYLTVKTDGDGNKYSSFADWYDSFTMTTADSNLGNVSTTSTSTSKGNYINYLTFTIDTTADPNASGNATIDNSSGTITYNSQFNESEYLRIVIRMKVSGLDRNISVDDDETVNKTIVMDTLRLGWDKDYNLEQTS